MNKPQRRAPLGALPNLEHFFRAVFVKRGRGLPGPMAADGRLIEDLRVKTLRHTLFVFGCAVMVGCWRKDVTSKPENEKDEQGRFVMGDLVLAPASESRGRVALLPTKPTEDVRHILGKIELATATPGDAERDYLPESAVSWIVDVRFAGDPRLEPRAVSDAFNKQWRESFGGFSAFGRDVDTGRWTYLISADGPKAVDQLKFAFDFIDILDEEASLASERLYAERLGQLTTRLQRFGKPSVSASVPPAEAAKRSLFLREVKRTLDMTAVLILQAPRSEQYNGKELWDVMLCLGLEWGDMDCFHWRNESSLGDDYFFSVETTTSPGYFLPEEVAAGRVQIDDLVFLYSVPRSAKPVEVFDAMVRAVQYGKSRLGGTIVDGEGNPADVNALRQQVKEVAEQLRSAGFEPGASATLQLF